MLAQATGIGESEFRLYAYDVFGRQIQERYATDVLNNSGRKVVSRYDKKDQLIEQQIGFDAEGNPLQTFQYRYDAAGNRTHESIVMEPGTLRTTETVYNLRGDVVEVRLQPEEQGAFSPTTTTEYDAYGNKTRVKQANGRDEEWFFDSANHAYFHRANRYEDQGHHVFSYAYHALNQRLWRESAVSNNPDDGVQIGTKTSTYDEMGQLVTVDFTYGDGKYSKTEYRRDERGNLLKEASEQVNANSTGRYNQETVYSYDAYDRLLSASDTRQFEGQTATPMTLNYTYDQMGNRRSVVSTFQGATDQSYYYLYDKANRLSLTQGSLNSLTNKIEINPVKGKEVAYDADGNRRYVKAYAKVRRDDFNGRVLVRTKTDQALEYVMTEVTDANEDLLLTYEYYDYTNNGLVSDVWKVAVTKDETSDEFPDPEAIAATELTDQNRFIHRTYDAAGQETAQTVVKSQIGETNPMVKEVRNMTYNDTGWLTLQKTVTWENTTPTKTEEVQYRHDGAGNVVWYAYDQEGSSAGMDIFSHITYAYFKSAKERLKTANATDNPATRGNIHYTYDAWGNLMKFRDDRTSDDNVYYYNAQGLVLTRIEEDGGQQHNLYADGKTIGKALRVDDAQSTFWETDIDFNFAQINEQYPHSSPSHYVVNPGDTLASIAFTVYGDASLWYLIADANGLHSNADLTPGMGLRIPNQVSNFHNTSDTFAPYNPADVIGDTSPSLLAPPPIMMDDDQGCTALKTIIVIVVIILVAHYATYSLKPAFAWAGKFAPFLAGAAGGAMGSIVGQGLGIALGIRDKFSWSEVGIAAVTAGIAEGVREALGAVEAIRGLHNALQHIIANVLTQGIGVALGVQDKFSWGQVAAAGIAGGIGYSSQKYPLSSGPSNFFERAAMAFGEGLLSGVVTEGVDAAVAGHGKIDYTKISTDAFGRALGNNLVVEIENTKWEKERDKQAVALRRALRQAEQQKENDRINRISNYSPVDGNYSPDPELIPAGNENGNNKNIRLNWDSLHYFGNASDEPFFGDANSILNDIKRDRFFDAFGKRSVTQYSGKEGGFGPAGLEDYDEYTLFSKNKVSEEKLLRMMHIEGGGTILNDGSFLYDHSALSLWRAESDFYYRRDGVASGLVGNLYTGGVKRVAYDFSGGHFFSDGIQDRLDIAAFNDTPLGTILTVLEFGAAIESLPALYRGLKTLPETLGKFFLPQGKTLGVSGYSTNFSSAYAQDDWWTSWNRIGYGDEINIFDDIGRLGAGEINTFEASYRINANYELLSFDEQIALFNAARFPAVVPNLTTAQRIAKLDLEGHAPIRHGGPNRVTDLQLEDRAMRGIDPASGTTFDAFNKFPDGSPKPHKVGRNATAFINDDALLQADDFARSSTQFQQNIATARTNGDMFVDPVEIRLMDVFGSNYQNYVRGVTRLGSKNNPTGHIPTNFTEGTIKAIYRLDQNGNIKLHTLYPNPKP